jgi:hypothetical protein
MEVSGQIQPSSASAKEIFLGGHCIGGWVDPEAALVAVEKKKSLSLPEIEPQFLCRPDYGTA